MGMNDGYHSCFLFEDTGEAFHQRSDLIYGAYHLPRCIHHWGQPGFVNPYPVPRPNQQQSSQFSGILSQFKKTNGQFDFNKMMDKDSQTPAAPRAWLPEEEGEQTAAAYDRIPDSDKIQFSGILSQFKKTNGQFDFNKMMDTTGQMVSAVNQVGSLVKGPYKVSEEDMETSWNEQTLTLFFPKK
jgi:hypothetical protein